ncbi:MAG: UPF0175 family protein [Planctomycetota bacterium]
MRELTIPYSEDLLVSSGKSRESLEEELRLLLAVKLFELRRVSVGKAAEIAGLNKIRFMDELARLKIAVINLDDDQIQDELHD